MVIKENVMITTLKRERTLHIYLPDDLGPEERLPVLYMFDGHNLFFDEDATYGKSWGLKDYLDRTDTRLMVVGIECNHEGDERLREFTPYSFSEGRTKIRQLGRKFFAWMVQELKPDIDERYPTLPGREYTYIGGSSMGGLMALYGAVRYSSVYSRAAAVSPHLYPIFHQLKDDLDGPVNPNTVIYISWGGYEYENHRRFAQVTDQNLQLVRALMEKPGVRVLPYVFKNDNHTEAAWEKQLPVWMDALKLTAHG